MLSGPSANVVANRAAGRPRETARTAIVIAELTLQESTFKLLSLD